jgi:pyridoxal phosphate enzyme (YggS family)
MSESIQERLDAVRIRVQAACDRSGRDPDRVKLVAVTKKFGADVVREAAECGLRIMGENRVQEAAQKIPDCPSILDWHLIGRLQTNKARQAVHYFSTVHSVDSERLIDALQEAADRDSGQIHVLLQVNVAGEEQKAGCPPEEVPALIERLASCPSLHLQGLMTMPPWNPDPEKSRPVFEQLRALRDRLENDCNTGLPELSMGMSHDFEVAIEEGATYVRLGTALFGERKG